MRVAAGEDPVAALRKARSGEVVIFENGSVFPGGIQITGKPNLQVVGEGRVVFRGGRDYVLKFSDCPNLTVRGLTCEGSTRGSGLMVVQSELATLVGNITQRNAKSGILTGNVNRINVEGNRSIENGEHGVYASQSGDHLNISGNHLYDNDKAAVQVNAEQDEDVDPNDPSNDSISSNVHVVGNVCRGNQRKYGAAAIQLAFVRRGWITDNQVLQHRGRHVIALGNDDLGERARCLDIDIDGNTFEFMPGKGKFNIYMATGTERVNIGSKNQFARRLPTHNRG